MTRDEAKLFFEAYLQSLGYDTSNNFCCPFHDDTRPSMSYHTERNKVHCFGCGVDFDFFAFIQNQYGLNFPQAVNKTFEIVRGMSPSSQTKQQHKSKDEQSEKAKQLIQQALREKKHPYKFFYLEQRGISKETANHPDIGYIEKYPTRVSDGRFLQVPMVVFVRGDSAITGRCVATGCPPDDRIRKKGGGTPFFNQESLKTDKKVLFVVEGIIDGLSVIECGPACLPIDYTSSVRMFAEMVKENKPTATICLAFDNDEAGKKATEEARKLLNALKVKFVVSNISGDYKDPNERLMKDPEGLRRALDEVYSLEPETITSNKIQAVQDTDSRAIPCYIVVKMKKIQGVEVETYEVSPTLLAEHIRSNVPYFFVKDNAKGGINRFVYSPEGVYKLISDEMLQGHIKNIIEDFDLTIVKMKDVKEVYNLLTIDLRFVENDKVNADENLINFKNGFLKLDTLELIPHTPEIFSTIQIPCEWKGEETVATKFDEFMETLTNGDDEVKNFLLQFMGAVISNIKGYRMKKSLFLFGEGNTGKSQYKSLIERLIGRENFSSIDLETLEARFGTGSLFNKRLAGSSDMSFVSIRELKQFKQATGGDSLFCEFKGENGFNFIYEGFLCFCMNALPKFGGDRGQWVYDRIVPIETKNVIPEHKQDKHLLDKILLEADGIIYKAIMALQTVIENSYKFDIPTSAKETLKGYQIKNNTVRSFLEQCCELRESREIKDWWTKKRIHDIYKLWCKDNNNGYGATAQEFYNEAQLYYGLSDNDMVIRTSQNEHYAFSLNSKAIDDYASLLMM